MISPERGSLTLGPYAFSIVDGSQRIVDKRASSRSKSVSLAAGSRAVMALLNPAARNTGSHISTPLISHGTHLAGVAGSMYQTIGCTGSETAAVGSFGSSRKRLMKQRRGPDTRSWSKSSKDKLKYSTRASQSRAIIGLSGSRTIEEFISIVIEFID